MANCSMCSKINRFYWIFFMRQMQGGRGGAMGFGKSKAKLLNEAQGKVTFNDVAGIEEAK